MSTIAPGDFGVSTTAGIIIPNTTQIQALIAADQATDIDPNINTSPDSIQGQENGIVADVLEQVWEAILIAYNAFNPDAAEGFLLDVVCAITGTLRQPAAPSSFSGANTIWVGLAPNVTIPAGTIFAQLGNLTNQYSVVLGVSSPVGSVDKSTVSAVAANVFTTGSAHTIPDGAAVILSSSGTLPAGAIVPTRYYFKRLSGTTFSVALTPGGAAVTATSLGTGTLTVSPAYSIQAANCTTAGPIACNPGTLTVIVTPITGLYSVVNPNGATLGTNQDTDPQLRFRRESELRASGSGSVPAIRASILGIEVGGFQPVTSAFVFENTTDSLDARGLPGHSFESVVVDFVGGGSPSVPDNVIAQTIWNNKPAGIQAFGTSSGTALDDVGVAHVIGFSRPTQFLLTYIVAIHVDSSLYDSTNGIAIAAIVSSLAAKTTPGGRVAFSWTTAALSAVTGVLWVETVAIQGGAVNTDFTGLGIRDYAYTLAGSITVNLV